MRILLVLVVLINFIFILNGVVLADEAIVICGTGDSQELLRTLARSFEKLNPGTKVKIPESIGSGGGVKATAMGKCDMGRVARQLTANEKKYGLNYRVFAKSPIVFVVHPSVTGVEDLTTDQIIGIYTGRYKLWTQAGGPEGHKIYPVSREEGDSSSLVLNEKLEGFRDIKNFAAQIAYSSPEAVELISDHAFTIGYGSLSMFKNTELKIICVNRNRPSEDGIRGGTYELVLDYGLVYRNEFTGLASRFMDYLYTAEAGKIMDENGAIQVH